MDSYRLLYSTHPSAEQARETAIALVSEKLAACCNLLPGIESHYFWEGEAMREHEVVLFSKTTAKHAPAAMARISALHPYETPAIVALELAGGDADFLAWLAASCRPA